MTGTRGGLHLKAIKALGPTTCEKPNPANSHRSLPRQTLTNYSLNYSLGERAPELEDPARLCLGP